MRADNMVGHLIDQFQNKPVLAAILQSIGDELDELDVVWDDLKDKRWLDTAEGQQLDGIGEIVGLGRTINERIQLEFFGFERQPNAKGFEEGRFRDEWQGWLASTTLDDYAYRLMLKAKINKNVTQGTAEDTIQSMRVIFDSYDIFLEEIGNAKIGIGIGRVLSDNDIAYFDRLGLLIKDGGIGVEWRTYFDRNNFFGFEDQPEAKGFDVGVFANMF